MWQEAMRRRRYLRDRAEAAGGGDGLPRSRDWLYESYYCMSQQHPLIVFLLLIVMGACLALLAVFFALRLVSGLPAGPAPRLPGPPERTGTELAEPLPAGGPPSARSSLPAARLLRARARGTRKVSWGGSARNKVTGVCTRWTAGRAWSPPPRCPPRAAAGHIRSDGSRGAPSAGSSARPLRGPGAGAAVWAGRYGSAQSLPGERGA